MNANYVSVEYVDKHVPLTLSYDNPDPENRQILVTLDALDDFDKVVDNLRQLYVAKNRNETRLKINMKEGSVISCASMNDSMNYSLFEMLDKLELSNSLKEMGASSMKIRKFLGNLGESGPETLELDGHRYVKEDDGYWRPVWETGYDRYTYGQEPEFKGVNGVIPVSLFHVKDKLEIYKIVLNGHNNPISALVKAIPIKK